MASSTAFLAGALAGSGLMYWLDPEVGPRRRAQLRGALRSRMAGRVDDDVLEARVRARLARVCSHPHAVEVRATRGVVELAGAILEPEVEPLLQEVARLRGLVGIDCALDEYEQADGVPALEAVPARPGAPAGPARWDPAARLLAGAGGAALITYGVLRGGVLPALAALCGLGLSVRGATNLPYARLTGAGTRRGAEARDTRQGDARAAEVSLAGDRGA